MSYGSTYMQFEANGGRLSQKFSRPSQKKEHNTQERAKAVHYEKQFDVNLTRVEGPVPDRTSVRESMLAYSRKMRSLQDSRFQDMGGKGDPLFVRAKHIPKYPVRPPKKRRPMSFDELLGRDRDTAPRERPTGAKPRPSSEKLKPLRDSEHDDRGNHLPLLSERLKKSSPKLQVSLVSASDLYDIVDFSIRTKGTRNDSLNMLKMERETRGNHTTDKNGYRLSARANDSDTAMQSDGAYNAYERRTDTDRGALDTDRQDTQSDRSAARDYVDSALSDAQCLTEDFYNEIFALDKNDPGLRQQPAQYASPLRLPSINTDPFRRRPNRAKRMKLVDPGLGDIPEDNVVEIENSRYRSRRGPVRVASPPPQWPPSKNSDSSASLDSIQEHVERVSVNDAPRYDTSSGHPDVHGSQHLYTDWSNVGSYSNSDNADDVPGPDKKSTKKVIRDDGDVRIEVTQCPPKIEEGGVIVSPKLKAQKRIKKLIYLRDGPR